jgi:hypothetical protein
MRVLVFAALALFVSAESAAAGNAASPAPTPSERRGHHWITVDSQGNCMKGGVKIDPAACNGCPRPKSGKKVCSSRPDRTIAPPEPR